MTYKTSDHFDGEKFFNPWGTNNSKSFFSVLKWKLNSKAAEWPKTLKNPGYPLTAIPSEGVSATWVNHSTYLLRFNNLTILTDPVWSERTSPFSFAGPKRVREPGVLWKDLPKVDVVVVSHNHYDHLDIDTLELLAKRYDPIFLIPLGDKKLLGSKGIKKIHELDWWESFEHNGARFTFTPAQHWSARWTWDRNESLWGGWGIEHQGLKVFHAGDSGFGPHFAMIKEKWGSPDLALLPIGAYEPRWFMKSMHMNPEDAVEAFKALGARQALGMHFGTFQLTDEAIDHPLRDLKIALEKSQIPEAKFTTLEFGQSFELSKPKQ